MYVYAIYKKHPGYKKARLNWKHQLMFACPVHVTKSLILGSGQGLQVRFNHFMYLFTMTCKQTAGIAMVKNNFQQLQYKNIGLI